MTPRQTVVVPAEVGGELRTGLYEQIDIAAEELDLLTMRLTANAIPSATTSRCVILTAFARCWTRSDGAHLARRSA